MLPPFVTVTAMIAGFPSKVIFEPFTVISSPFANFTVCLSTQKSGPSREDGSFHGPGVEVHPGFDRPALEAKIRAAGFGPVRFSTPCEVRKDVEGGTRTYPMFLAIASRVG